MMTDRLRTLPTALTAAALLSVTVPAQALLTFSVEPGGWPNAGHRDAAVNAIQAVVDRYNAFAPGGFDNRDVYVYFNAGIPTAQASFHGSIGFGGTFPNERVMQHEMAHYLGLPSGNWGGLIAGGWSGAQGAALVKQFDGDQAVLNGDGAHFWPYGLNFDNEFSEINAQRQVALVYAMRADLGIGPAGDASPATVVTLTGTDQAGESGFNYAGRWSDGHFAHDAANYYTGNYSMLTPASGNSYTFAGNSLTLDGATAGRGLLYKGTGSTGVITIDRLVLDGGFLRHASGLNDRFQIDGRLTVAGDSHIAASAGNIDILADIFGSNDLTIHQTANPAEDNRYVTFLSPLNSFLGDLIVDGGRFRLESGARHRFLVNADGTSNTITGENARAVQLKGVFEFNLPGGGVTPGQTWALVDAANTQYTDSFQVAGFTQDNNIWSNPDGYTFSELTGLLTYGSLLIGDTDGDGDIDDFDLLAAISSFTGSLTPGSGGQLATDGDTDGDGDVDDFDLLAMISGFTGSLPATTSNVPEPGGIGLLALAGLGLARRRVR